MMYVTVHLKHVHGIGVAAVLVVEEQVLIGDVERHVGREDLDDAAEQLLAVLARPSAHGGRMSLIARLVRQMLDEVDCDAEPRVYERVELLD